MKKGKKKARGVLLAAAMMLLGAALGVVTAANLPDGTGPVGLAAALLLLYAAYLMHLALHEAGHMVCGLLTGYRFVSFRLGSVMLIRTGEGLRVRRFSLAGTGGQCLMEPPERDEQGRFPFVLYNLGGALMNFVCALAALALRGAAGTWSALWWLLVALTGFFTAATNAIPLHTPMLDNDGQNVRSIAASPETARAFWVQMKIGAYQARGVRLRDMPDECDEADAPLTDAMNASLAVFHENRLMDAMELEAARGECERLLGAKDAALPGLYRVLLELDLMCLKLLAGEKITPPDKAQRKFMQQMRRYPSVLRTEYFLALLDGRDAEKAAQIAARFDREAARYPYPGDLIGERELMARADEAAREADILGKIGE